MTEQDWLASDDPAAMLRYWRTLYHHTDPPSTRHPVVSDRKLRLFAVACARQVWDGRMCERCDGTGSLLLDRSAVDPTHPYPLIHTHTPELVETVCPDCRGTGKVGGLQHPRSRKAVEVAERYADMAATPDELAEACLSVQEVGDLDWAAYPAVATGGGRGIVMAFQSCWNISSRARQLPTSATQADLLRCIVGNPFRPVTLPDGYEWYTTKIPTRNAKCSTCGYVACGERVARNHRRFCHYPCPWLTHNDGAVVKLATVAYEERCADPGTLEALCDELLLAGCPEEIDCWYCNGSGCGQLGDPGECGLCNGTGRVPHPLLAHLKSSGTHVRGCWVIDLLLDKE